MDKGECIMTKRRIMIVDDDIEFLEELKETLSLSGYDTYATNDSLSVFSILRNTDVDAIIMDMKMSGLDGFQLAQQLKKSPETAKIPIIAISGYMSKETYGQMVDEKKMESFIRKPFNPLDVISAMENIFSAEKLN